MEKNVLAIVVTYNRCKMLKGCLDALKSQTVPCHIFVVDNASDDKTQETVAPYLNEAVQYCRMEKNLGGAGGFNFGMRYGVENGYQYLWIMDDDAYPEPNALEELLNSVNKVETNFGFLCSAILWKNGKECRMNRQGVDKRQFYDHVELLRYGLLPVMQSTFVSCFFQASTVTQAGLPISDFFIWGDDIEYTRRLAVRMKLPCYLVGKSIVVHHMAQNTGSDISTDAKTRLNRYRYAYRNENYLYRQEGLPGICYYLARCGYHFLRIWLKAKDHRLLRSWILCRAFVAGWFFNPVVEYMRESEPRTVGESI